MSDTGKIIALAKAVGARPDPDDVKQNVEDWLDDHPEATTTVQDGSITKAKLDSSLSETVDDVGELKSALAQANDLHAQMAEDVGTTIRKVKAKIKWAWTDVTALSNITLKAGKKYRFSIEGSSNQVRYMNLLDSNNTSLRNYNKQQDGYMEYTPSTDRTGCILRYNSNVDGAEATIWYEVVTPNTIVQTNQMADRILVSGDELTNNFIKELYIENADPNTTYKFYFAARNNSSFHYSIGIGINGTTTIIAYLQNSLTEPSNVVLIPAYGASGKNVYAILDWSVLEDGSNTEYNIKLKDNVKNVYNWPTIYAYLRTIAIDSEIKIPVPSVINCFVGETLQLYYRSMFLCVDPYIYDVKIQCDIGDQFPRYYEVTPISADVGNHTLKINIQSNNGKILGSKNVVLKVHAAPSTPASNVNVLAVGASCTQNGEWVGEMKRVLTEDLHLSNINFVGRKQVNGVKLEATGGYTWGSYTSTSVTNLYKFYFTSEHLPSVVNVGNVYSNNNKSFTVTEINIPTPDGGGYISCTGTGAPSESGTLTLTSGEGDPALTFSSTTVSGNPFLYGGSINLQQYATDYCDGTIDVVYTELFVNDSIPYNSNVSTMMDSMKAFCQMFHTAFPNCKIAIGMPYCPDIRGGIGVNYHAVGGFSFGYGIKTTFMNYMLAVEKYLEDNDLDSYVSIVNWLNEFDSENDFRQTTKPVNIRSTVTEIFGVNGIHPSNIGYYQMSDSAVRHFVANFCQ